MSTRIATLEAMVDLEQFSTQLEALQRASGLCDPLTEASCTLIQTANSFYLFRVTVPHSRRGLLVGGAMGEAPVSAVLIGALPDDDDDSAYSCSTLTVGVRAVFLIEKNGSWKYVITSRIARLAHSPVRLHERLAMSH